ncbi:phage baseplate protein [Streptomyces drozdowiczii]|uniref:Signaling protein n=1 Tax=Streptomyces drozdowiczii TaxID=202862 RepID=A0ABY6PTB2_9ACTN|nr:signaling protein [Streptomyces drozdowiczii]MCX0244725.1 signaling protein [Streptomyces drozdowiczii]UZK55539.1 signaling protein [Streptomyces drozdowiczii]
MSLTRRTVLTAATAAVAAPLFTRHGSAQAPEPIALAADPVAAQPAAAVHAQNRFDLTAEPVDLFGGELRLAQGKVHQQVAFDAVTGLAYVTQLISDGRQLADEPAVVPGVERDHRGDLCVNEVTPDGTVRAVMYLRGVGHGGGLGVEHVDDRVWLWLETDADPVTSGFAYGKRIGRVAFTPGAIVDAGSPDIEVFDPTPGASHVTPSLDLEHGRIGVRQRVPDTEEYLVYDLEAFKRRSFTPLFRFPAVYRTQAWCLYGDLLYQNEGNPYSAANPLPGNSWWNVYDITTGHTIERRFNTTALGLSHRETEAITVRRTPDGPQLVFGFATREPGPRQMTLFGITATTDGTGDHVPWTDLNYESEIYTPPRSTYVPQYRQVGNRVDLHLRLSRIDGVPWTSGEKVLTLPPHIRPNRTQGLVGQVTGAGVSGSLTVRWEVLSDGSLLLFDERQITGWVGLDGGYFTS